MDVGALVGPVVERAGYELVDVAYTGPRGRRRLRVTVDRDNGLDLESLATLSEAISRRLDLEGFGDGRYELEVSSPGIERPLRTPAHFAKAVGSLVRITTAEPVDGATVHEGVLAASDEAAVTVTVGEGSRRIELGMIASARTVADWDAELKGTKV